MKIKKAIILAAGYGTRFLPASKSIPKEMLPIIDKPILHYVVQELVEAGINDICFVTSSRKKTVEDYFDSDFELETKLSQAGKLEIQNQIKHIYSQANFSFVRQPKAGGTGDAILRAKNIIGNSPFIMLFGDDFIKAPISRTTQLLESYEKYESMVFAGIETDKPEDTKKYGFASGIEVEKGLIQIEKLVEKPGENKPSNLAIVSGYIFNSDIFSALEQASKFVTDRELYYLDGVEILKSHGKKIYGLTIKDGKYYDCGNPLEYLKTCIEFGLEREDIKHDLKKYLKKLNLD